MKRTIRWPPKVRGGRLPMTEDPESDPLDADAALRQIIRLNLLDGTSGNPWGGQAGGAGLQDQTFARNAPTTKAVIRSKVRRVFQSLERTHRAKLVGLEFPRDPDRPARLVVRIVYSNLETGGRQSMEIAPNG